jgi:hypothetical protein
MAKLIGVTPQPVDKYPDGHMEMADAVDTLFGPSLSNPGASAATEPGPSTSTTSTQVQMRLEGLCKLRKVSVSHTFTPKALITCLRLSSHLKPSSTLADVVGHSAALLLGDADATGLVENIRSGSHPLPGLNVLRYARICLDCFSMVFERHLQLKWSYWRYIMIDTSKVAGHSFVCIHESRLRLPRCPGFNIFAANVDLNIFLKRGCAKVGRLVWVTRA